MLMLKVGRTNSLIIILIKLDVFRNSSTRYKYSVRLGRNSEFLESNFAVFHKFVPREGT